MNLFSELRKIPLQKYLVQCQNDIEFPVHVKRASVNYNFSPIIAGNAMVTPFSFIVSLIKFVKTTILPESIKEFCF